MKFNRTASISKRPAPPPRRLPSPPPPNPAVPSPPVNGSGGGADGALQWSVRGKLIVLRCRSVAWCFYKLTNILCVLLSEESAWIMHASKLVCDASTVVSVTAVGGPDVQTSNLPRNSTSDVTRGENIGLFGSVRDKPQQNCKMVNYTVKREKTEWCKHYRHLLQTEWVYSCILLHFCNTNRQTVTSVIKVHFRSCEAASRKP